MWLRILTVIIAITLGYQPVSNAQTCNDYIPESTPASAFVDHGDSTVSDSRTGLMWQKCLAGLSGEGCLEGSPAVYTWQEALQLAESINSSGGLAGYTDWRLPSIKELTSIVELKCGDPSINLTVFPNQISSVVWSGSAFAWDSNCAWFVNFNFGDDHFPSRSNFIYVRLVRGGQ